MNSEIESLVVCVDDGISSVLRALSESLPDGMGSGRCILVNAQGVFLSTVTDADIRRNLARFGAFPESATQLVRSDSVFIHQSETELSPLELARTVEARIPASRRASRVPVTWVPILDDFRPVGIINLPRQIVPSGIGVSEHVVIGLGFVGLTLAAKLAGSGAFVTGIESNPDRLQAIVTLTHDTFEPGLDDLLGRVLGSTLDLRESLAELQVKPGGTRVYWIALGTHLQSPLDDPTAGILELSLELSEVLRPGDTVILRSSVPVGFTRKFGNALGERCQLTPGQDFYLVFAPERTVEGDALRELGDLPQIISGVSPTCIDAARQALEVFNKKTFVADSLEAAEMSKLASNAWRDYSFGFANYLAKVASEAKVDVNNLIELSNRGYSRNKIPNPSPGVGGTCLVKDSLLLEMGRDDTDSPILSARRLNASMPAYVLDLLNQTIPSLKERRVLLLGMAFKGLPETSDIRHSPSIEVYEGLQGDARLVSAWDARIGTENDTFSFSEPESNGYDVFLLMTNNPKNVLKLHEYIEKATTPVWIFDPWRLLEQRGEVSSAPRGYVFGMSGVVTTW